MAEEIKIRKNGLLIFFIIGILILTAGYFFINKNETSTIDSIKLEGKTLEAKFEYLSNAGTNFCADSTILEKTSASRLQGSCCSAMDFHRYSEQVEWLKAYSYIEKIPSDPYDIPREWAEEMINYDKNIQLTVLQQEIYDEAMEMSMEGGPCCCKCWRWYAYGGLAKYLIINYDFTSEQIAEVWDLSDGCGGSGHAEGEGH